MMRTTVELKDEHRARLLEMAALRGEKGFSNLIAEALDIYLAEASSRDSLRREVLGLRGTISEEAAETMRATSREIRESWR